ncbi:rhomboid family intramembrane serine protease [Butyrivibrio sp. JL13D10]|uniref:rhomboid family intramembrane serine protease n=1 Tax=Butyrivibrio sp. JL13D10 TaxID=3236815 RepID=UPI0038B42110
MSDFDIKNEEENKHTQDETVDDSEKYEADITEAFWNRQLGIMRASYINSAIIIMNIVIFIYSMIAGESFINMFDHRSELIILGSEMYRLITSMFLHADLEHLFSNMLILFFVGANVEHDVGHIAYLFLYFLSGIIGNLSSMVYDYVSGDYIPSIGASGAVFGIIGAVAVIVLFGRNRIRKGSNLIFRLGLMIALSIYSGFTAGNIDNAAHIGGLLGGIVITLLITVIGRKKYTMEEWL